MNAIERYYRILLIRERLQQIESELIVLAEDGPEKGSEQRILETGIAAVAVAANRLAIFPVVTGHEACSPAGRRMLKPLTPNLKTLLERSIARVKAQNRAEETK